MKPIQFSDHTHTSWKQFCKDKDLGGLAVGAEAALQYFMKTGIDPTVANTSEFTKILAGIAEVRETFVTFIRTQESEILHPMAEELARLKVTNAILLEASLKIIGFTADKKTAQEQQKLLMKKLRESAGKVVKGEKNG